MAGGLLNLIAIGNQNVILNGNPTKSFFKCKYLKYTNFGMQKYRIDQTGQANLNLTQKMKYSFKIPRYADLLMDTYLVINLPNIWSPILKYIDPYDITKTTYEYRPYEFQWIKNLGSQIIDEITINIGPVEVQKYSGQYLQNMVERDFYGDKKKLYNIMTGNIDELNDPANFSNRKNNYPNAWKKNDTDIDGIEPSIHGQQLYIPINTWFTLASTMALPLICLQYEDLVINFTLKPIQELFTIKDVIYDISTNDLSLNIYKHNDTNIFGNHYNYQEIPRIQPEQNKDVNYGYHRFIQQPPVKDISSVDYLYEDTRLFNNYDIHLITTQCFLDNEERILFAQNTQNYLIKKIYEHNIPLKQKTGKITFDTNGLVSSWMWYMQRNDVYKRNEWSNYTNWPYENNIPNYLEKLTDLNGNYLLYNNNNNKLNLDASKNIYITGYEPTIYEQTNQKNIMKDFAIIADGKYRENSFPEGLYNKIEKYARTTGSSKEGLYTYNFCLNNDPFKIQPTGAFNTNKFKTIEFEYNNYQNPPIDLSNVNFSTICDPDTGEIIATSKEPNSIYTYNYNLHIFEERYNILQFNSGTANFIYNT
tara:strand:- start:29 stop:1798 length:1770 start_codon:yes stop_codon:yes gene_type:complete